MKNQHSQTLDIFIFVHLLNGAKNLSLAIFLQRCRGRWWPRQGPPSWMVAAGGRLRNSKELWPKYTHRPLEWRVAQLQALLRCQVWFSAFSRLPILAEQGVMTKMKTCLLRHWPKTWGSPGRKRSCLRSCFSPVIGVNMGFSAGGVPKEWCAGLH